jgi:hypothetical protein
MSGPQQAMSVSTFQGEGAKMLNHVEEAVAVGKAQFNQLIEAGSTIQQGAITGAMANAASNLQQKLSVATQKGEQLGNTTRTYADQNADQDANLAAATNAAVQA